MGSIITMFTGTETKELSLVDSGANRKKFATSKSEENDMNPLQKVLEVKAEGEDKFVESLKGDEQAKEAAVGLFRLMNGFKDILGAEAVASVTKAAGFEAPAVEPEPAPEPEPVVKSEDPQIQAAFKAMEDRVAKAEKEAAEAQKASEVEKALRQEREYVAKAEEHLNYIPEDTIELGKVLKSLNDVSADLGTKVFDILKKVNEGLSQSEAFKSQGTPGTNMAGTNTADQRLRSLAEKKAAESDGKLTVAKAYQLVLDENPDLYEQS